MGTLSARALRESLQKARNVGIVEDRFPLFDDLEIVVRNLRPDEYESINADVKEKEELEYLYAFQLGHVKRAIVEINGVDLREVQFVEDEEDDPKNPGRTRAIKLELPDWLFKNYLCTWSKEAIYIAFRKVEDAVAQAEKKARLRVEFMTPEETDEDRYRRLVAEVKELEDALPAKLVDHVLDQSGYMRKSTAEEVKRAMEVATNIARDEEAARKAGGGPPSPPAAPVSAPPSPVAPPAAPPVAAASDDVGDIMRQRKPMNQAGSDVPLPVIVTPSPRANVVAAGPVPAPPPPEQVHPPINAIPGPPTTGSAAIRSARTAALESEAAEQGTLEPGGAQMPARPTEIPILERRQAPIDPAAAATIIDRKPQGGINPHYRPATRRL